MQLKHFALIAAILLPIAAVCSADQASSTTVTTPELHPPSPDSEDKDVVPENADLNTSTQSVTPAMMTTANPPYQEAQAQLVQALALWNSGHPEAASDTALQAYENYGSLRRVRGVKRAKIRSEKHQAASLYVEAGIATIKNWLKQAGRSNENIEEARARFGDLNEVARDYHELKQMLDTALSELDTPPTTKAQ